MIEQTISHYRIMAKLGEGGMGVIYKAQDIKLNRTVALKFLSKDLTRDTEAVDRFISEAQIASSLDHANICTIYEINETDDGKMFICMAYYEGETLAQKIKHGPLPVEETIAIARQIAEGLERVHEAGITHRDLKPTNIILTDRGVVKIVDFGIAKLAGVSRLTKTGTTLGTLAYMSPEQVQKQSVNHRSDIWSLGVVFYEMLTGELPFQADSDAAMIYSIVNENPEPIVKYRSDISEGIHRIIGKALDKNPETRYQRVSEFLEDLELEQQGDYKLIKPPLKVKTRKSKPTITRLIGFIFMLVMTISFVYLVLNNQQTRRISPTHKQITFTGNATWPAISPDGQFIAYTSEKEGGYSVFIRELIGGQPLEVFTEKTETNYRTYSQWSPDGTELLIKNPFASLELILVPRLGGSSQQLKQISFFPCWSPDGSEIAHSLANLKEIWFTNKTTGEYNYISLPLSFEFLHDIDWSPLGNRLSFLSVEQNGFSIWTTRTDGNQQYKVVEEKQQLFSPRWSANGDAIYFLKSQGQTKDLQKIDIDITTGKASARPKILQTGLQIGESFTLSRDNKHLLYTRELLFSNLWQVTLNQLGREKSVKPIQLTSGTSWISNPSISPDGAEVVISVGKQPNAEIFVMSIDGRKRRQLTFLNGYSYSPVWNPDGKEIAFGYTQNGTSKVWKINAKGGTPRPYNDAELSEGGRITWAPGTNILYQRPGNRNFHILNPITENEQPLLTDDTAGWIFDPQYSPDRKNLVVARNLRDEGHGLWIFSFDDSSLKCILKGNFFPIGWSIDGKWIYFFNPFKKPIEILQIPVAGGRLKIISTLPFKEFGDFVLSPDRTQLICIAADYQSDVWVMENFDPETELETPVKQHNWQGLQELTIDQQASSLLKKKKYRGAEEVYRKGLELDNNHPGLLRGLGHSLRFQERYEEAKAVYQKGLKIQPDDMAMLDGLGSIYSSQKIYELAEPIYRKILSLDYPGAGISGEGILGAYIPGATWRIKYLTELGFSLFHQGKYEESENIFHQGLEIDRNHSEILIGLSKVNIALKKYNDALSCVEKCVAVSPSNLNYSYLLQGKIHMLQKNYQMAELNLEEAFNLDSSYTQVSSELGYLFANQQNYDRAMNYAQKAVSLDSSFANQNLLAWVLVAGEFDIDRGIVIAEKSLGSKPEDWAHTVAVYSYYAVPEHTIGLGYLKKGEYEEAVQFLEQAAKFAPEREDIKIDLQLAKSKL